MVGVQLPSTLVKVAAFVVLIVAFQMSITTIYTKLDEQRKQQEEFMRSVTGLHQQQVENIDKINTEMNLMNIKLADLKKSMNQLQEAISEQKLSVPACVPSCPSSPPITPAPNSSPSINPPVTSTFGEVSLNGPFSEAEMASQAGRPLKIHPRIAHILEKVQGMSVDSPSACGSDTKILEWHISIKSPNIGTLFGYLATSLAWCMFKGYQLVIPDTVNILPYFEPVSRCTLNKTYTTHIQASQADQLNPQGKNARGGFQPGDCRYVYWYESMTNNSCFGEELINCDLSKCKALPPSKKDGPSGLELASKELLWWRANVLGWLFQPTPRVMDYINAEKSRSGIAQYTKKTGGPGIIGIHIRRGDKVHGGGGGKEDQISPLADFFKSAEEFRTKYGVNTVYLISDDMKSIKQEAAEFTSSWKILYDEKTNSAGFYLSGDTAPDQVVMDSIRDAWLLSDCDYVVTKLTSFYSKLIINLGVAKGTLIDFRSIDGNKYLLGEVSAPMFQWLNFMPL